MIHTVKMPEQDAAWLNEILDLQIAILRFASELSSPIGAGGSELSERLSDRSEVDNNAEAITAWVVRKTGLFKHLSDFAEFNDTSAKGMLISQIAADMDLLKSSKPEGTLQIRLPRHTHSGWQLAVGRFLYQWYDTWSKRGLDYFLFVSRDPSQGRYSRQDFLENYVDSNPRLLSCPICDAGAYRNETTKGVYTSIDHFFPRSLYPHLALHPYNLLPMCPACNSGQAGQGDPQDGVGSISELNLPYRGQGLGERVYIRFDFRPLSEAAVESDAHALKLSFEVADGQDSALSKAIERFNAIYAIDERWNKPRSLTLIDEHAFRRIRQFLLSDVQRGEAVSDPKFLMGRLELLMALVQKEGVGRDPFAFATVWWLMWQIQQLERQGSNQFVGTVIEGIDCDELYREMSATGKPLLTELAYWACEQQKGFALLKEEVQKLRKRIPTPNTDVALDS